MHKYIDNESLQTIVILSNTSCNVKTHECLVVCLLYRAPVIFSRQASLILQAFLITALHGAHYKTRKNAYAKK